MTPGAFTVLLGPNGAGKTTLFALITRLYHAHAGRIAVFGRDFRDDPQAALARMGVVFQQPTLDLDLTVEQNLFYHTALHGMARVVAAPRIAAELERVGLLDRRRERARLLSGGQRRRVEVARALLHSQHQEPKGEKNLLFDGMSPPSHTRAGLTQGRTQLGQRPRRGPAYSRMPRHQGPLWQTRRSGRSRKVRRCRGLLLQRPRRPLTSLPAACRGCGSSRWS